MTGAGQVGHPKGGKSFKHLALILASCFLLAPSLFGQTRFGQTRGGYPLPSVSSMGAYPRPSVSSMGAFGYGYGSHHHPAYSNGSYRGYGHSRGGWGYALPYYYIPLGDYGYGYDYDYVGGPDMYSGPPNMYSGPPPGANESTLHIIVEQPPAQSYRPPVDDTRAEVAPPPPTVHEQPSAARDAKPREPTVLVFRDGHQKEVGNYAIMGQTVYVLDDRTQKISLADLDVPATVKANDDRGMEFKVPAVQPPAQKKSSDLQPNFTPDQNPPPAANVASVLP
jgi:hypothetical protein